MQAELRRRLAIRAGWTSEVLRIIQGEARRIASRTGQDSDDLAGAATESLWRYNQPLFSDPESGRLVRHAARRAMWREVYRSWERPRPDEATAVHFLSTWSKSQTGSSVLRMADAVFAVTSSALAVADPLDRMVVGAVVSLLDDVSGYYAYFIGVEGPTALSVTCPSCASVTRYLGLPRRESNKIKALFRVAAQAAA